MTSQEYSYELKIPKDRVAVLIGKKGEVKKEIESATKTKLNIDSKEGDVLISGKDALNLYTTREIVKAIARGFNPEIAKLLLKPDYAFELISLNDYTGKNKSDEKRIKGRLIGSEGKSRKTVEELSETYICVYGKTVGMIGRVENVSIARKAVESIIRGSPNSKVYRWLESKRKEMIKRDIEQSWIVKFK